MPLDTWQEQLRRGSLDLAILLSVSSGPRYGLAIIQHLEAFTDLVVTEGTIYPILGRLTREGPARRRSGWKTRRRTRASTYADAGRREAARPR